MRSGDGLAVVGLPEQRDDESIALLLPILTAFRWCPSSNVRLPPFRGSPSSEALPAAPVPGAGSTRLYLDGRTFERGAVGMMLAGQTVVGEVVVSQGCRPVGPEMVVTAPKATCCWSWRVPLLSTSCATSWTASPPRSASSFGGGPQLGLAMDEYADEHEIGDYLIRAVLGIDEKRGAVAVGDVVDVGRTVRFQLRDADAARADLRSRLAVAESAQGALLISCNGRGRACSAGRNRMSNWSVSAWAGPRSPGSSRVVRSVL